MGQFCDLQEDRMRHPDLDFVKREAGPPELRLPIWYARVFIDGSGFSSSMARTLCKVRHYLRYTLGSGPVAPQLARS